MADMYITKASVIESCLADMHLLWTSSISMYSGLQVVP